MGDGTFADVSNQTGADDSGIGREVIFSDLDNDGRIDFLLVNFGHLDGTPSRAVLYANSSITLNNWLTVRLVGTTSNSYGMGARVKITANGVTQIREMGASQGHVSQSVVPLHFGLGQANNIDEIEVRWPSGIVQVINGEAVNQHLVITEP